MKKILFWLLLGVQLSVYAQEDAWVYFIDKPQASYYLDNPLEMLAQRALDRRAAQGIALDEKDVPVHEPYAQQISEATGITVMARSKWLNALHIRGSVDDINALATLPFVLEIDFADDSLDGTGRPSPDRVIKPVNKIQDATTDFSYGVSDNQIKMLNGQVLHQQNYTGQGITIAVLDAGFPGVNTIQPFQRLRDNNLILGGYNFVDRSENIYTRGNHGTLVLSTMGGHAEGQLVGTAPDAFYYLFITEDTTSENPVEESYWVEAAEMADSLGVDVINTSLGYFLYDNPAYNYSYEDINGTKAFITRGANVAFTRGIFLVNSGGNSGATVNPHVTVPADAFNTLTVGAATASRQYASFSSIGPTYDMRIKPDVMAQGNPAVIANSTGEISTANGTSVSSPIVAGLVACLWQALPNKTNAEILELIRKSADRYILPDVQYGYGIPDFALALNDGMGIERPKEMQLVVFPNPTTGKVSLILPYNISGVSVTIHNNLGQVVLQAQIHKSQPSFSIEPLSDGIYYYRIETGFDTYNGKLIKE